MFEFADGISFKRDGQEAVTYCRAAESGIERCPGSTGKPEKIENQEKEIKEETEEADITIRAAQTATRRIEGAGGCRYRRRSDRAGERSRNKRELQKKLDMLEQELKRNGDGLSIEELEQEAGQSDIDAIEGELEQDFHGTEGSAGK